MAVEAPTTTGTATVLVVEDETDLADLYANWLSDTYDVRTADDGASAVEALDDEVDVVLLDRRLPDRSGDEVLETITDEGYDCNVAMVSAVDPDFDIVDFHIDDYVTKPVEREALLGTVEDLLLRGQIEDARQELLGLISRRIALEREKRPGELDDSPAYRRLVDRIEKMREHLDGDTTEMSSVHRPEACPSCDLRWDINVDGVVGFVPLAARVWKCTNCGEVVMKPDPTDRSVARR